MTVAMTFFFFFSLNIQKDGNGRPSPLPWLRTETTELSVEGLRMKKWKKKHTHKYIYAGTMC